MLVFDTSLLVAVPASKWAGEWVMRGSHPSYRGELASQLRLIRKRHGTPYAREWVKYIDWIGAYPLK